MGKNVLVLTGSARPNSAGKQLLPLIEKAITENDASVDVANVAELGLPFYDAPTAPAADGFVPEHDSVKAWGERVEKADAVIWLMPEYNHAMTAIQKNAVDWLYKEWQNKPLGIVAYGFYGGKYALEVAKNVMDVVSPDLRNTVGFALTKDLEADGTPKDEVVVYEAIAETVAATLK